MEEQVQVHWWIRTAPRNLTFYLILLALSEASGGSDGGGVGCVGLGWVEAALWQPLADE